MKTTNLTTVATYGRTGGSARVRIYEWLDYLKIDARRYCYANQGDNSISTVVRNIDKVLNAEISLRLLASRRIAGSLLMSREGSPFSNGRLEARLLSKADLSIYDFDDAIYHASASFPQSIWPKSAIWRSSVSSADRIIAGNEYLAEEAAKFSRDVTVIPSCVNPDLYQKKQNYELNSVPTLVWLGSPSTEQFLPPIADALLKVNRVRPIRLRVVSAGTRSLGELDLIVDRVEWSEQSFVSALHSADLGIMPLTDNPFSRGKCAYKLLQYGAAALPVIGSPVGTNRKILDEMGGASPATTDQWEKAVHDFLDTTEAERRSLGTRAYATVSAQYSFQAWQDRWSEIVLSPGIV